MTTETMNSVECPSCGGSGKVAVFKNTGHDYRKHTSAEECCSICKGSGKTTEEEANKIIKRKKFWENLHLS